MMKTLGGVFWLVGMYEARVQLLVRAGVSIQLARSTVDSVRGLRILELPTHRRW